MLIEFRVANHRSIREEQVLSMEAGALGERGDLRPRTVQGSKARLLTVAALYGANASGKSNVLSALGFMIDAVLNSTRHWDPEGGVRREPFAWGDSPAEPSLFEVSLLLEGIKYRYGFTVDDREVVEEWLEVWPKGRKQSWYSRERGAYKFSDHLGGNRKVVRDATRSNALFLSTAAQLDYSPLFPLLAWFWEAGFHLASGNQESFGYRTFFEVRTMLKSHASRSDQPSLLAEAQGEPDSLLDSLTELLRAADLGICGLALAEGGGEVATGGRSGLRSSGVRVEHQRESGTGWLPLELESDGTRAVLRSGPRILRALQHGGLLIADELEASLHPLLVRRIVEQFNDPVSNPNNAQLIFSTHDSSLLGTSVGDAALRRDQVWLTEKNGDGATDLSPLTDFKPRTSENLERGLLQGRYGAVPYLGSFPPVDSLAGDQHDDTQARS